MSENVKDHTWEVDGHKVQCLTCGMVQTQETAGTKCGVYPLEPTPPASHDAGEADQLKALAYAMLAHGYGKDSQLVIGAAERIATLTAELAEARAEVERLREAALATAGMYGRDCRESMLRAFEQAAALSAGEQHE